jgi:hypothetical protein
LLDEVFVVPVSSELTHAYTAVIVLQAESRLIREEDQSPLLDDDDVVHFYSAHIHTIECSWRLADVLACSQKVSNPEMRLVSAAIGASFHFPF